MGRRSKADEPAVFSRLEEWRVARGLSRQELADAVSVHYQTIGYLERDEYSPSLALALQIASVLDVPLEELFSLQPFTKPISSAGSSASSVTTSSSGCARAIASESLRSSVQFSASPSSRRSRRLAASSVLL